ncbi:hypothetical protein QQP08_001972, partial [Theobroma cacao]
FEGVEVVFHKAAPNPWINNYQLHHWGSRNLHWQRFSFQHNSYSATKAKGEALVIQSKGSTGIMNGGGVDKRGLSAKNTISIVLSISLY